MSRRLLRSSWKRLDNLGNFQAPFRRLICLFNVVARSANTRHFDSYGTKAFACSSLNARAVVPTCSTTSMNLSRRWVRNLSTSRTCLQTTNQQGDRTDGTSKDTLPSMWQRVASSGVGKTPFSLWGLLGADPTKDGGGIPSKAPTSFGG